MSEIIGLRTRLKPGMEEAYEKAHAEVWPELVTAQLKLGIDHWLIFRHGVELFHVVECDDFDGAIATLSNLPLEQRWQSEMARFVVGNDNANGAALDRLRLVYRR
jgi:L-rhamnose mutarotase